MGVASDITERKRTEKTLRSLHGITASQDLGYEEKLVALLESGCEQFNLPFGILSHVVGEDYRIVQVVTPDNTIEPGSVFALSDTYCRETLMANGPIGFEHAGATEWKYHPCYREFKLEAYLGIPVVAENEVYGTLNFSSPDPYEACFSATDKDILRLMAQ